VQEVAAIFAEAGYGVAGETLRRWTNAVDGSQPVTSPHKHSGAPKALDEEQRRVAAGWVLCQERKVGCRQFRAFVSKSFGTDISQPTASRYLDELDLSWKMLGSRPRPAGVSFEMYAQEGYDDIVSLHNDGFFLQEHNLIWAVDWTSTAIRQQRYHSYGAKGGKQQKYT